MAKYVMSGMYKGGNLTIEAEFEKPDIGAFRKLVAEAKDTFGGGYASECGAPVSVDSDPPAEKALEEPEVETPMTEPEDDGLGLDDPEPEPEELDFSRTDVANAAKEAMQASDLDDTEVRKAVAAVFKKFGGSMKLAEIDEAKYGKIIRALKAGI